MIATSEASFDWFWQPPMEGRPGLMMVVDTHPGPAAIDIKMVHEDLRAVLQYCEGRLPKDVQLYQLGIYVRDVLGLWIEIKCNAVSRHFQKADPELSESDLNQLWASRSEVAGGQA